MTSIFSYKGIIEKAIKKLKYHFISNLEQDLVELFLSNVGEDKYFVSFVRQKNVVLIPVPLHPRRFRWRGFNQAQVLGKMIADNLDIGFIPNLLKRIKRTKPQTKLKGKERLKNVRGAFKFNEQFSNLAIEELAVVLFDDVFTTGATLKESVVRF